MAMEPVCADLQLHGLDRCDDAGGHCHRDRRANLPLAWDYTTGSGDVIVAVIDTGISNHLDLNGVSSGATYTPAGLPAGL